MQLNEPGALGHLFEMKAGYFQNVVAQLLPVLGLSEDGMAQRPRCKAALFRFPYFEDQFHGNKDNPIFPESRKKNEEAWGTERTLLVRHHGLEGFFVLGGQVLALEVAVADDMDGFAFSQQGRL